MDITYLSMSFVITTLLTNNFSSQRTYSRVIQSLFCYYEALKTAPCFLCYLRDIHSVCLKDWDREKLLEAWMSNPENCCQRSGVQMPTPPPSGYNAWDTLPSPRTPRTTRSSVTSPDELSLSPGDLDTSLVWFSTQCTSHSFNFNVVSWSLQLYSSCN